MSVPCCLLQVEGKARRHVPGIQPHAKTVNLLQSHSWGDISRWVYGAALVMAACRQSSGREGGRVPQYGPCNAPRQGSTSGGGPTARTQSRKGRVQVHVLQDMLQCSTQCTLATGSCAGVGLQAWQSCRTSCQVVSERTQQDTVGNGVTLFSSRCDLGNGGQGCPTPLCHCSS